MPARRKTGPELERHFAAKAIRSVIRLKYSIAAEEEINKVLFNVLDEFDAALAAGEPFDLSLSKIIDDVKRLPA